MKTESNKVRDSLLKQFPWITKIERNSIWHKPHGVPTSEFKRLYERLQQLGYKYGLEPTGASIHFWKPRITKKLTEDEAKTILKKHIEKTGLNRIAMIAFAMEITDYLGHKTTPFSETAHKLAEKYLHKWVSEGKLELRNGIFYIREK